MLTPSGSEEEQDHAPRPDGARSPLGANNRQRRCYGTDMECIGSLPSEAVARNPMGRIEALAAEH